MGGPKTATSTVTINVTHTDIAPVNTVPTVQAVADATPLVFSSGNGNAISVSDADSQGNAEQISLSVSYGTLTLSGTTGLTITSGANGSTTVTVQGTLANLNAALNGLSYVSTQYYNGADTLTLVTNDLGNSGVGGPKTAASTVTINVTHTDLAPVNTVPGAQAVADATPLVFSSGNGNAISVSDADSQGNAEQISLTVSHGTLTLSGTTGLTITAGANGSATMTVQGTLANLNAALNGLSYVSTQYYNGADTLTLVTNDLGNSGVGGPKTAASTVTINVTHTDIAPVNTVPGAQNTADATPLVFSAGNGNTISVSDADSQGGVEQISLSVSHGTLTLSGTTGLTITSGANGSATMTVQGTLANLNAALNGLSYVSTQYYNGADTLTLVTNDLGNSGVGGPKTATSTVTINVTHTDLAPVNTVPGAQNTADATPLVFSGGNGNAISVSDADSQGGVEQISLSVSHGTLTLSGTSGLTITAGANGSATMTVQGTLANLNAALNGLSYVSTQYYNGADTLTLVTNDLGNSGVGGPKTAASTVTINVTHTDIAPVNTVPTVQAVADATPLVFSAGNGNAISLSDADSEGNAEQISLSVSHGTLTLSGTSGLTITAGANGSATMTVQGTLANLNAALNGLSYVSTQYYNGADTLTLVTNDLGNSGVGGPKTAASTVTINVTHTDIAPVNTVPGAQNTADATPLVFSGGNGNAISVSDADSQGGIEQISLSVSYGTLTLSGTTGLTITAGANGTAAMTVQGTLSNINAALNGLSYVSTQYYNGADTLTLVTNDLGNSGVGGPKTAASTVTINVTHTDIAPVNTVPTVQAVADATPLVFSAGNGNAISLSDADSEGNAEQISLSVSHGTLTLSGTSGLTITAGANGSATMTVQGTLANLNAALNGLSYASTQYYNGTDTLTLVTNDLGNSGVGGPKTAASTVTINVTHTDIAPVNTVPGAQNTADATPLVFSGGNGNAISVSDADSQGGVEQISLSVSHGTLTLSGTSDLTITAGANGSATMTVQGTLANLNAALNGLSYVSTQYYNGTDTLTLVTNDLGNSGVGGPKTAASTVTINVTHTDLAPVNTVPGAQSTADATPLVFFSGNGNALSVSDADSQGGIEQISLSVSHGTLTLSGTSDLTITAGANGTAAVTLQGTLANLNAALNGLSYVSTQYYNGTDTLTLVTNDLGNSGVGGPKTAASTVTINVTHTDLAPVNTVPGAQSTADATPLVFSSGNGNALSVSDADSQGGIEQISLSVSHGTLTLSGTTGLTITSGANGSATMTVQGTLANLNAALNGLSYVSTQYYNGADTLTLVTNDLGNSGVGGPKTAASTVTINVTHTDITPVISLPGPQNAGMDVLVFSQSSGNAIVVEDVDAGTASI